MACAYAPTAVALEPDAVVCIPKEVPLLPEAVAPQPIDTPLLTLTASLPIATAPL